MSSEDYGGTKVLGCKQSSKASALAFEECSGPKWVCDLRKFVDSPSRMRWLENMCVAVSSVRGAL